MIAADSRTYEFEAFTSAVANMNFPSDRGLMGAPMADRVCQLNRALREQVNAAQWRQVMDRLRVAAGRPLVCRQRRRHDLAEDGTAVGALPRARGGGYRLH